jgi:hypothetical protein
MKKSKPKMLTPDEAAALVDGLNATKIRKMCRSGKLQHLKLDRKYYINQDVFYETLGHKQLNFDDCE